MTVLAFFIAIWVGIIWGRADRIVAWVGLYFFASFGANLMGTILIAMKLRDWVNVPGNLHNCIAVGVLSLIYIKALGGRWRGILKTIGPILFVLAVLNLLFWQGKLHNSYSYMTAGAMGLILGISYFYQLMRDLPTMAIQRLPIFWFNTSFLVYSSSTLLQFIFRDYLAEISWEILGMFHIFHNAVSLVSMGLILIGLYYAHIDLKRQSSRNVSIS